MQSHLAVFGETIADGAFELGVQREHGAEYFAERGEIVVGNPATEMQQLVIEHGGCVEDGQNSLGGDGRFAVVQFDDDAHHALLAKWDEHASADDRRGVRGDAVGEDHVQRHGDGDVTEFGHRIQRIAVTVEER